MKQLIVDIRNLEQQIEKQRLDITQAESVAYSIIFITLL